MTDAATGGLPSTGPCARPPDDRDRLALLAEVSDAMIRSLDTGETADRLARLAVPRLADWATVTVLGDDGGAPRTARAHRDPQRLEDLDTYLNGRPSGARDRPALMTRLLNGRPVQLTSADPELSGPAPSSEPVRAAWERLAVSSVVLLPLIVHGETIGALSLANAGDRPPHTAAEVETAMEVARRGGLALDNARLYGRQLKVAETLQRSLLTPPPHTDDLDIAVRYRPASRHTLVGGDFYDAFLQPDGAMSLVVGDVVGHSVDATAAMSELRSTVRALAYDHGDGPGSTLQRTDRALTGLGFGTLATVLVASLEQPPPSGAVRRWALRWSSAGHPPPLLLRERGGVEVLERPAERLLGTGVPTGRSDHLLDLRRGDTVVLYTDGLLEHQRTGIDEGLRRLSAVLAGLAGRSAAEVCDEVLDRVVTGPADDDVALLVVRPR
ncbi:PP2C family protein-serine/threonine phosphatase [Geodermatophilus sp. CPCC 206100]|uniref:PP2C family protein-serine/threonine phosphatase n=1 Tax=Geodermatophilus sp. CPCC 206100 TaxID=3020054 RepID=UPI003B0072FE